MRQLKVGKSGFMRQDQPQRGCILQPNVAVAATLGAGMKFDRVNRNAVATALKAGVFHLRLYASQPQPLSGLGKSLPPGSQGSRNGNLGLEDGTALRL